MKLTYRRGVQFDPGTARMIEEATSNVQWDTWDTGRDFVEFVISIHCLATITLRILTCFWVAAALQTRIAACKSFVTMVAGERLRADRAREDDLGASPAEAELSYGTGRINWPGGRTRD
jgi:hypothetical protein